MEVVTETEQKCICPNCGEPMKRLPGEESIYVCEKCGCTIEGANQNLDADMCCPNCNQLMDGSECPYCGYDLGSDFD